MATRVKILGLEKFGRTQSITIQKLSERQLRNIAVTTEKVIQRKITESLQRPGSTGNLANSFFAEPIGARSWGVGNISYLNSQAPYWRWINFGVAGTGRTTPPITIGAFSPGNPAPDRADFRKGRFFQNSSAGGEFLMIPTRPIQPHNYIQRTLAEVPTLIDISLSRIKR